MSENTLPRAPGRAREARSGRRGAGPTTSATQPLGQAIGWITVERDRKSDVPVILYAEFTAKPGSESQVQTLISDLAEKVRLEPGNTEFTIYRERDNPRKFFVFEEYLEDASFEAHIGAEYGVIFNVGSVASSKRARRS